METVMPVARCGKYTAWDDPAVDQTVEDHLRQIVAAVRSRTEPRAIILRGSFSQGEGTVVREGNGLRFLSDYELMAITPDYQDRRWLREAARDMTTRLGVETSISRVHPSNIEHNSLGNVPIKGVARPTIAMYELQHGGRTLYGEHLLDRGPSIDPAGLDPWVGLRLMLNRMAESLERRPPADGGWDELRWINKTILSCSDALLIIYGQYHHSYAERGRRFAELAPRLETVLARASFLPDLVQRATDFKLRPDRSLYPESLAQLWTRVKQACDATLRCVISECLGFSFSTIAEFPELYLSALVARRARKYGRRLPREHLSQSTWLGLKFLRGRRLPPAWLFTHLMCPAHQVVYAVVPLVFLGNDEATLQAARRWLGKVTHLRAPRRDREAEWDYLRARTIQAWRDLCYGMWDVAPV